MDGRTERGDPQDLVVTLLAIYRQTANTTLWSGGLVRLLKDFGFSQAAARAALSRLVRRGLMRRLKDGRLVFYEMTDRCRRLVEEGDRRILTLGMSDDWDGTWTVLWHSVPDDQPVQRNRLARRLRFLGFRPVQDAIWVSPHRRDRDVLLVVRDLGVDKHVGVLIGTQLPDLPVDELIRRGWDLGELNSRYERFAADYARFRSGRARQRLTDRDAFVLRTRVAHIFWQFATTDPDVPDELMPSGRARHRAAATFHDIFDGLLTPAQRYFDAATSPDAATTL